MAWTIRYYQTPGGQDVIRKFIDSLQLATQTKLARRLDLLEQYGNELDMPHAKPLGDGLMELRVRGQQEIRILYVFVFGNSIYLLHGFTKKSQAIPKEELDIARARQTEIKKRS